MSGTGVSTDTSSVLPDLGTIDMKLEVVTLPVSDVDRAKRFYQSLGWRTDADIVVGDAFRAVQLTPHHSSCSIAFGKGLTTAPPGSVQRLELVVDDIDAAREDLIRRGVEVSEVFHLDGGRVLGPDPQHRSYMTYASFSDPDGNAWLLQEIKNATSRPGMGRLTGCLPEQIRRLGNGRCRSSPSVRISWYRASSLVEILGGINGRRDPAAFPGPD